MMGKQILFNNIAEKINKKGLSVVIDKRIIEEQMELLFKILFVFVGTNENEKSIATSLESIYENLLKITSELILCQEAENKLTDLFNKLPEIKTKLYYDAQAFVDGDPAAYSIEEVILAYPGFFAITVHRIAHELYKMNVPIIPRIFSEFAHSKTGIDIHPGAQIGKNIFLDHGTGVVIGETCVIGDNVKIYQGVTLGSLYVSKQLKGNKRHPTIENNVVIYANATILGGDTIIGANSIIGGNVWITKSISENSKIYYNCEE